MEIIFPIILLVLFLQITWFPAGLLALSAYIFLDKIKLARYELPSEERKSVLYWGWISVILFILMFPVDVLLRHVIDIERISNWFARVAGIEENESQTTPDKRTTS